MGQVVTVMNMKGGVGKTTVTAHIAGMLASYEVNNRRLRVLAIDYDPQFNLSQAYLKPDVYFELEKRHKTSLAILQDRETDLNPFHLQVSGNEQAPRVASLVHTVLTSNGKSTLDLIPSTLDLMYIALGSSGARTKPMEVRFSSFIEEAKSIYDLILIDCHPAGSVFTKTSLQNSDHVLIPVVPQKYAVRGIGLMMEFIRAKGPATTLPTAHVLFNRTRTGRITAEEQAIRLNPKFASKCFTSTLKDFKAFAEMADGANYVWRSKKPYSTTAFRNVLAVMNEFAEKIKLG